MTEATAVEPGGRITPFDLGLWNEQQETAFSRIASFVNDQGSVPGIQLSHAGRKASHSPPWEDRRPLPPDKGGWDVVGPSPTPWEPGDITPLELTTEEIAQLVEKFQAAAKRAYQAGFRVLEVHAAHGYLFHSFLSPLSNRRKDGYGGNFDERARFLLETVKAIRDTWPSNFPLFVRVSAKDWVEGGWELDDTVRLAKLLSAIGVDAIDCSSGGIVAEEDVKEYSGYQVPFAETVRREAKVPTVAVGAIREPSLAEEIVANGQADLVAIGRLALWDPYWPYHAAKELKANVDLPVQYARADVFAKGLSS
jgi:2,4-dienoyl-CoA reductase-like NADH-dependent reductase (Old Yellow Enzyme family)